MLLEEGRVLEGAGELCLRIALSISVRPLIAGFSLALSCSLIMVSRGCSSPLSVRIPAESLLFSRCGEGVCSVEKVRPYRCKPARTRARRGRRPFRLIKISRGYEDTEGEGVYQANRFCIKLQPMAFFVRREEGLFVKRKDEIRGWPRLSSEDETKRWVSIAEDRGRRR